MKEKENQTQKPKQKFPLVDALLLTPKEGKCGAIGICTNTSSPGEVLGEIDENNRKDVCVLGSLIVSRDGVERMILNSLAHPTLKYLILFSEESMTFAPSTNLLQAIISGFDEKKDGNYIKGGVAASPHYPNLNDNLLQTFRNEIIVLPIFIHTNSKSREIIGNYIEWLKPKISEEIYSLLKELLKKEKIYYDSLNKLIETVRNLPESKKNYVYLDPKEFQQLAPPKIELKDYDKKIPCPFKVSAGKNEVRLDLKLGKKSYFISTENVFLLAYSLMKFLGKDKKLLSPAEQLLLGLELGRAGVELSNKVKFAPFIKPANIKGAEEIPLEPRIGLKIDEKFYYRISVADPIRSDGTSPASNGASKKIKVLCMAFDVCAEFFELISKEPIPIIERLAKENRFDDYEMDILHRIDIGTQLGRAAIAAKHNYSFIQDFNTIFKLNKSKLPFVIAEGDNFLDVHKSVLRKIYTEGITALHGDPWKGMARTASVLAIYRNAEKALQKMPRIYEQGKEDTAVLRQKYKAELLRKDHDGTYTYGERTRAYFGFDQLEKTAEILKKNPRAAAVIARFDPIKDMSFYTEKPARTTRVVRSGGETGKIKYTHDPCLTHDIFFIQNGKLNSFHIARAHNCVNAYPENIFGLYDAYVADIRQKLGLASGDMYMLSNRGNILLISEEQRTKRILSEPSKPVGKVDTISGPYLIDKKVYANSETARPTEQSFGRANSHTRIEEVGGVAYFAAKAKKVLKKPKNEILDRLLNYEGANILEKAVEYLKQKGVAHNNPILSEYYPRPVRSDGASPASNGARKTNPQADQLVFFQANAYGKKICATAVFANRSLAEKEKDLELCNYLMTQYGKKLKLALGEIAVIYVGYKI